MEPLDPIALKQENAELYARAARAEDAAKVLEDAYKIEKAAKEKAEAARNEYKSAFLASLRWMDLDAQRDVKDERRNDVNWCDQYKEDLLTMRLAHRRVAMGEK